MAPSPPRSPSSRNVRTPAKRAGRARTRADHSRSIPTASPPSPATPSRVATSSASDQVRAFDGSADVSQSAMIPRVSVLAPLRRRRGPCAATASALASATGVPGAPGRRGRQALRSETLQLGPERHRWDETAPSRRGDQRRAESRSLAMPHASPDLDAPAGSPCGDADKRPSAGTGSDIKRENGYRAGQVRDGAAEARRLRRRDGRPPARDLRLRVLHQEPAPARLRQPAQGPAHLRQGGGGQRARRLPRRPGILPDVVVKIEVVPSNGSPPPPASQATRFRVTVIDNGPGIVRQQIPPIFGKLLYGSKFHRLRMSRGQQGIGISAAGMYGQLTTGKPVQIISRTSARAPAHYFEVQIDTKKNEPRILENKKIDWESHRGTQVTLEIEGRYQKGRASVDEYLEQTAIANPHVTLVYHTPEGQTREYPRTTTSCRPSRARSSRIPTASSSACSCGCSRTPRATRSRDSSPATSAGSPLPSRQEICRTAKLSPNARPRNVHGEDAEALYKAIQTTKIMAPPTNCLSPIGEKAILHGLYKQIKGEFYTAVTRPPAVYRGNPVRDRGGARLRQGTGAGGGRPGSGPKRRPARRGRGAGGRQRARPRHPLREPRAAALPAVGVRDLQGRARHHLAQLRRGPVAGRAPGRAHGDLRPHGLGLGAVHQRVQGSDRRLRRDPQGDQARAAGVRAPARRVPPAARAGARASSAGGTSSSCTSRRSSRPAPGSRAAGSPRRSSRPSSRRSP